MKCDEYREIYKYVIWLELKIHVGITKAENSKIVNSLEQLAM